MKKKVLVFHHHGSIGGAGLSLLHIVRSIDKNKYDVIVACPQQPSDMIDCLEKIGVTTIRTNNTPVIFAHYNGGIKYALSIRTFINVFNILKDKKNITKIINDVKPDIVMVNSMLLSFVGKYIRDSNVEKVCFCRETYQRGLFGFRTHLIKKWMSNHFDKIAFISEHDKGLTYPCNAKKYLITDKVEIKKYKDAEIRDYSKNINLLYLGGVAKIKGIHILLKSINYVNNKRVVFTLIADPKISEKPSFIDYILSMFKLSSYSMAKVAFSKIKDKSKIVFLKPSFAPEDLYAKSHLIVFPSTVAHQSRPVYEAGVAKIPIIISDFPETKEFTKNEYNCLTFRPCNYKDLARQIDRVIENENLRKYLLNNNYQMTLTNHNYDDLSQEIDKMLDE